MSSWEEKFRIMKEKPTFCRDLTRNIEDDDVRNEEFSECMLNPLKYMERKYKDELCVFGRTNDPNLDDLLECKRTENIINLMAKDKEGLKSCYEINKKEALKRALEDLVKFKGKEIEPLKPKERRKTQKVDEREYYKLEVSCLPTESHLIEYKRVEPPRSDPSAGEGNSIMYFLRSLASTQKPHIINQRKLRPPTVAATHQYQHKKEKFDHKEHLEDKWEEEFFAKLKEEKRIQKKGG